MFKTIVLLSVLGIVACVDVKLGSKFGKKIYEEDCKASPALWRRTKVIDVTAGPREMISGIFIEDRRPKKDGVAYLLKGGETHKYVSIQLKSPAVFRGYDFHVEVYSAPDVVPRGDIPALPVETDVQRVPHFEPAVLKENARPRFVPSVGLAERNDEEIPQSDEPAIVRDFDTPQEAVPVDTNVLQTPEDTNIPQVSQTPKDTIIPQAPQTTTDTNIPQVPQTPEDTNIPQVPQTFESAVTRDIVLTPQEATAPFDARFSPAAPAQQPLPVDGTSETPTTGSDIVS